MGAPGGDTAKPPKFGTPTVAEASEVPRVIKGIERAPQGLTRFKIRAINVPESPTVYVLAKTEASACDHYHETFSIPKTWEEDGKDKTAKLSVVTLPD